MQLITKTNFYSFKDSDNSIHNYTLETRPIIENSHLVKKNIFLNTALFFSSPEKHELKIITKQRRMNQYLRDEILWVIEALLPSLDHCFDSDGKLLINDDDPINIKLEKILEMTEFDTNYYDYSLCIIKDFSFFI